MRRIKINFEDEFPGFKPEDEFIYRVLSKRYEIEISNDPDYLFVACFGHRHLKYNCIKIFVSGENQIPDFNLFDYAIGFDPLSFGDRYLRMPLFPFYKSFLRISSLPRWTDEQLLNRKFCSFVVSNNRGDPLREQFFKELSKYKKVYSGGRYLNNIGNPVADKIEFCEQFKFNIAFENSSAPGYTTEKIMEPLVAHSIPIYYGNPKIEEDVDLGCMVHVNSANDVKRAIEEVIDLDKNDDKYLAKCRARSMLHADTIYYEDLMMNFLSNIIEQPLANAKRVISYGCQPRYRIEMMDLYRICDMVSVPRKILQKFKF